MNFFFQCYIDYRKPIPQIKNNPNKDGDIKCIGKVKGKTFEHPLFVKIFFSTRVVGYQNRFAGTGG